MTVRRYTTLALPAYSYVPGRFPHPHSDDGGHRFTLADADPFLLGVDLFNHGYYWEAHEVWEAQWNTLGRRGSAADFVKALIQLAVVGVKIRQRMPDSAAVHARRAAELLRLVGGTRWMGLDVDALRADVDRLAEGRLPTGAVDVPSVEVLFSFALLPDTGE